MSSERQLLESESRWWGEHLHRYNEAIKLLTPNDTILDIACGTGFGTAMLAGASAGNVIGGDIAKQAIEECKSSWEKSNMTFQVMDGTQLPFPDHYFDTIVSFETIEHTTQYKKMLEEFFRTLKPGGQLILSTPNAAITSPDGKIGNPFHTQEFKLSELKILLETIFTSATISGQRYSRYDKKTLKKTIGKFFEMAFLTIGIRKLPYSLRNGIMKTLFGYSLYPAQGDFVLENNEQAINKICPVLFAVCKK